jgi:hypothetical protein
VAGLRDQLRILLVARDVGQAVAVQVHDLRFVRAAMTRASPL